MSTKSWSMIVLALSVATFLAACGSPNPQPPGLTPIPTLSPAEQATLVPALQGASSSTPAPVVAGQGDAALGATIYLERCSPCHGDQGQGVSAPPLRNSRYIQTAGDQAVFTTIAAGRPKTSMPAWLQANGGPLTDAQISSVIAYLHTLQ